MHVSIDLDFHKLATVPPSRPSDSSLMVIKILGLTPLHQTTLLKFEPHKGSSTLMSLGRGATPWVLLGLKWTWVMGFSSYFPNSHVSWMCPTVLELLSKGLPRQQYQNPWFPVKWRPTWAGCAGAAWNGSRRKISCLWYVWGDGKLLFPSLLVKRWHNVGSTYCRHWAHPLTVVFLTS